MGSLARSCPASTVGEFQRFRIGGPKPGMEPARQSGRTHRESDRSPTAGLGGKSRAVLLYSRPGFPQCHGKHGARDAIHRDHEHHRSPGRGGDSITNTAITLGPDGREISRYDKIHLVPFGEYVPWWALPGLVHKITSDIGNFVPGRATRWRGFQQGNIGVFICYEAIIPQLARHLVANGAGVVVNISNDAWYGDSAAAYQHLEMARLRAIENHRYLLRATE